MVMRYGLIAAGSFSLVLGVVGIFVPLLPTTPFLLLSAACYAKSSRRLHDSLLRHRILGAYIRNYTEKKALSLGVKICTLALLWLTIIASAAFATTNLYVRIVLLLIAGAVSIHLLTLRTIKDR